MEAITLTAASLTVFTAYLDDAPNWSGTPLVGGNVGGGAAERGNLTDLKVKGLITTSYDAAEGPWTWLQFTDKGLDFADSIGLETKWVRMEKESWDAFMNR